MPKIQALELNDLVERSCALLGRVLDARIGLRLDPQPGLPSILGDPALVEQMILRLGLQEADALGGAGGTLWIRTYLHSDGRAVLEFQRDPVGAGATPAQAATRQGALHEILDVHGVEILKDGPQGSGWMLALLWPAGTPERRAAVPPRAPSPGPRLDGRRILVAEDEPEIRYFLREILGRLGAEVVSAVDGEDAWNLWSLLGPFDLLLTDQRMPRMTGMELLKRVREDRPGFPVVIMSGYGMEEFVAVLGQDPRLRYLAKPFMVPALVEVVGRLLAESPSGG